MLKQRGADARLLIDKQSPNAPSVVYGEIKVPGAKHTIVFYAHYDGQPVTPAEWTVTPPSSPHSFCARMTAIKFRIYARARSRRRQGRHLRPANRARRPARSQNPPPIQHSFHLGR